MRWQEPKRPFPYCEEEVIIRNDAGGVTLAGTLTFPKGKGPFPAFILLTGAGAWDRDVHGADHRPFLVIADHLTRAGCAVLRMDDRGVGKSTGEPFPVPSREDSLSDISCEIEYLQSRSEIKGDAINLAGHSDGALLAITMAGRSKGVSSIVLLGGGYLPMREMYDIQIRACFAAEAEAGHMTAEAARSEEKMVRRLVEILGEETDNAKAKARMIEEMERSCGKPFAEIDPVKAYSAHIMPTSCFRQMMDYDPREDLKKVQCPILALGGAKDRQCVPEPSFKRLKEMVQETGNSEVTMKILPDLNHLFRKCKTGAPSEYPGEDETFSPDALDAIVSWLSDRGVLRKQKP